MRICNHNFPEFQVINSNNKFFLLTTSSLSIVLNTKKLKTLKILGPANFTSSTLPIKHSYSSVHSSFLLIYPDIKCVIFFFFMLNVECLHHFIYNFYKPSHALLKTKQQQNNLTSTAYSNCSTFNSKDLIFHDKQSCMSLDIHTFRFKWLLCLSRLPSDLSDLSSVLFRTYAFQFVLPAEPDAGWVFPLLHCCYYGAARDPGSHHAEP